MTMFIEEVAAKKVLLIVRDFPPFSPSVGSALRAIKLVEWLKLQGLEPVVLHARALEGELFGYEALLRGVACFSVEDRFQYERMGMGRAWSGSTGLHGWRARLEGLSYATRKKWLIADPGILSVSEFVKIAQSVIEAQGIRHVITSSPPHSVQCVGLGLKRCFGKRINWIADFRDSWSQHGIFRSATGPGRLAARMLEKRICRRADWISCATEPITRKLPVREDRRKRVLTVMNGFDRYMYVSTPFTCNQPPVLGYFGSLRDDPGSYRNPRLLFPLLKEMDPPLQLEMWGDLQLSGPKEKYERLLKVNQHVDHAEAIRAMRGCDALLFLHTKREGADEVVSAKIFDYVLAERPVLCIAPREALVYRMVQDNGWGYVADSDATDDIRKMLVKFRDDCAAGKLPSYRMADFMAFERTRQFEKLKTPLGLAAVSN